MPDLRRLLTLIVALVLFGVSQPTHLWSVEPSKPIPNPMTLSAGWWGYFDATNGNLPDLIKQAINTLDKTIIPSFQLDEKQRLHADIYRKNLEYLAEAKANKSQPSFQLPQAPALCGECNLDNFLEYTTLARDAQLLLKDKKEELRIRQSTLERTGSFTDDLMLRYQALSNENPQAKFSLGLEIMAARSSEEVTQLRLKADAAQIDNLEKQVGLLDGQQKQARTRLTIPPPNDELKKNIEDAKKRYQSAREELARREISTTGPGNSLLIFAVNEVIEQLRLLNLEMRFQLRTEAPAEAATLAAWKNSLDLLTSQLKDWRKIITQRIEGLTQFSEQDTGWSKEQFTALVSALSDADEEKFLCETLYYLILENDHERQGWSGVFKTLLVELDSLAINFQSLLFRSFFKIGDVPLNLWSILRTFLILVIAWYLSTLLRKALTQLAKNRGGVQGSTFYVFSKFLHYGTLTIALIVALSLTGLDFTNLFLVGGALGIGIGFGLQGVTNNFICGLIILFERNFRIGDYVQLPEGQIGRVTEINFQNSLVHTYDGMDIIIPNGELISNRVINWTLRDPHRRFSIPFGVAYGTDPEVVEKVVLEAAERDCGYLSDPRRPPQIWMTGFGDSAVNFALVVWVDMYKYPSRGSVNGAYLVCIEKALREGGIQIPFPQRDLHIKNWPNLSLHSAPGEPCAPTPPPSA